jgi:hypothetical protein
MPCTIRSNDPQRGSVPAIAKELARDSAIVLVCGKPAPVWLKFPAEIIIRVALPVPSNFRPRCLEIEAIVTHTGVQGDLLRVTAAVHRMTFVDRNDAAGNRPTGTNLQEIKQ